MEHDFTLDQLELIRVAVTARFKQINELSEAYSEIWDIRTRYVKLIGVISKCIADQNEED